MLCSRMQCTKHPQSACRTGVLELVRKQEDLAMYGWDSNGIVLGTEQNLWAKVGLDAMARCARRRTGSCW